MRERIEWEGENPIFFNQIRKNKLYFKKIKKMSHKKKSIGIKVKWYFDIRSNNTKKDISNFFSTVVGQWKKTHHGTGKKMVLTLNYY